MIADWRAQWSAATFGEVSSDFPFGYVQLNGLGAGDYASDYNASGPGSQDRAKGDILPATRFDYDSVSTAALHRHFPAGRQAGRQAGMHACIWVELNVCLNQSACHAWMLAEQGGFPGLRWAQSAGYGYNPNPTQVGGFNS